MPSPTWSTEPPSASSVPTSYSSILDLRMAVISSGRSFKSFSSRSCGQFPSKPFEPAAHARVDPARADLQDDPADQPGVDAPGGADPPAGRRGDLVDDRGRVLVGELERRRQLDVELALLRGDQPLELPLNLVELADPALLREQAQEVPQQLVAVGEERVERRRLRPPVDLRVLEHRAQL